MKEKLFTDDGSPYVQISVADVKKAIQESSNVIAFESAYNNAFADFSEYLYHSLIDEVTTVEINKEEAVVSENIFARMRSIPLIDRYEAYQILDDGWAKIAIDLEVIQTEGFDATKKVDPNLVIKKKDGKDQEVQEGWVGHIVPFELVQSTLLSGDFEALKAKQSRLAEIPAGYEEIIDSMTEDEKGTEVLNDANDAFVPKEVTKKLKELRQDEKTEENLSFIAKLEQVEALIKDEKDLKAQIKKDDAALQAKTKETIEALTDEQARTLLSEKWILPIVTTLQGLPESIVDTLVGKLQALSAKYATTYFEVETQIKETEAQLASMIDSLCGSEFDMKGLSEFKSLLTGK